MSHVVNYEGCEEVFVGAGWAGVYSFYRRIVDDPTRGASVCLFEQSWRIGGRTYSVKINRTATADRHAAEFVQDVGAYRYSPDMRLPGDLIDALGLATECYQEHCPSAKTDFPSNFLFNYTAPLRRIVDPSTRLPSGYVTPLHRMIDIAEGHGGRVFTSTGLVKFDVVENEDGGSNGSDSSSTVTLQFSNSISGQTIHISDPSLVVLNLPRNKLFDVSGIEESLDEEVVRTLKCTAFDTPPDLFSHPLTERPNDVSTLSKAYLYYDDAWWQTMLNVSEGEWPLPASFLTRPRKDGLRFNLRWHDGPVECDIDESKSTEKKTCHGLLEIYYSVSNETFYSSLAPNPDEPLGSVWNTDGKDKDAVAKLSKVHAGLMDSLSPLLHSKGVSSSSIAPPTGMIVGVWNRPNAKAPLGLGYTAPTKLLYDTSMSGPPNRACGVAGLTDERYRNTALQPWANENLRSHMFLVNNDYVCMNVRYFYGDWAEESLLQAERAMFLLRTPRPEWLDETYYAEKIASMASTPSENQYAATRRFASHDHALWTSFLTVAAIVILCFLLYKRVFSKKTTYSSLP